MVLRKKTKSKEEKPQKFKVKSWYANRYQFVLVQRNILLIFALFSVISVSFGMIFLNHIVSSKSLEPYIIEIEDKTGIPVVVDQLTSEELVENRLMTKYFLNQFLRLANRYKPSTYKDDINKVRVLASRGVMNTIRSRINHKVLGSEVEILADIKSINFPTKNIAKVRMRTTTRGKGIATSEKHWIIDLSYVINPSLPLTNKERLDNPLGFQVINYNMTEEIVGDN